MSSSARSRWKTVRMPAPPTFAAPLGTGSPVTPAAWPGPGTGPTPVARPIPVVGPAAGVPNPLTAPAGAVPSIRTHDDDAESETTLAAKHAVRAAPPWLISAVLHMLLLIILALTSIAEDANQKTVLIEAGYAEKLGDQLEVDLPGPTGNEQRPDAADPILVDLPLVDDPLASGPKLDLAAVFSSAGTAPVGTGGELSVPSIGLALTGREKGAKRALLAAYGGTSTTEGAVQLGLEWLSKQQDRRTGLWRLNGPYSDGVAGDNPLAATALALLAFQGAGETHQEGRHQVHQSQCQPDHYLRHPSNRHILHEVTLGGCQNFVRKMLPRLGRVTASQIDRSLRWLIQFLRHWQCVLHETLAHWRQ